MVHKALETIVAFANTEGGNLVLGIEDVQKAQGADRLYGIAENPEAVNELQRKAASQITPPLDGLNWTPVACQLRDGTMGEVIVVGVPRSGIVHSLVDGGTWKRLSNGNRQMTAHEINELSFARGVVSAETEAVEVPFELLDTEHWRTYCQSRGLSSGEIKDRMFRVGLAKRVGQVLLPRRAAVLLFAEDPSGLLAQKAAIRVFHYSGSQIEHAPSPNLLKKPKTITGALIKQIEDCYGYVVDQISDGLRMAASGFETVHRCPARVIKEAITNAVIHRDYRINRDIHVRIFDNRIEVESPGLFPGDIRPETISRAGSLSRNSLIVSNLREFPTPPNIDAGEGVRMMFSTMRAVGLYPPFYFTRPVLQQDAVMVMLLNEERPPVWEQVSDWLDRKGFITNPILCKIAKTDTLKTSKMLRKWVSQGMLTPDMSKGKRHARYFKSGQQPIRDTVLHLPGFPGGGEDPIRGD
jgi:ATP-dependent DNA helicase RecG